MQQLLEDKREVIILHGTRKSNDGRWDIPVTKAAISSKISYPFYTFRSIQG